MQVRTLEPYAEKVGTLLRGFDSLFGDVVDNGIPAQGRFVSIRGASAAQPRAQQTEKAVDRVTPRRLPYGQPMSLADRSNVLRYEDFPDSKYPPSNNIHGQKDVERKVAPGTQVENLKRHEASTVPSRGWEGLNSQRIGMDLKHRRDLRSEGRWFEDALFRRDEILTPRMEALGIEEEDYPVIDLGNAAAYHRNDDFVQQARNTLTGNYRQTVLGASDRFRSQYEAAAQREVHEKEIQDEKERKKDMQRKRRRVQAIKAETLKMEEGEEKAKNAPDEEQRERRRESFVSEIWANRPPVENVVNHLDEFFPGVDLDQPYLEESATSPISLSDQNPMDAISSSLRERITYGTDGLPVTLSKSDSDTLGSDESTLKAKDRDTIASVANVAQRQLSRRNGGLGRMKSIREVVKGRNANELSRQPSSVAQPQQNIPSSIVRRKSTKMFGAYIREVEKAQKKIKLTQAAMDRGNGPDEIHQLTPLAPNLEGGTTLSRMPGTQKSRVPPRPPEFPGVHFPVDPLPQSPSPTPIHHPDASSNTSSHSSVSSGWAAPVQATEYSFVPKSAAPKSPFIDSDSLSDDEGDRTAADPTTDHNAMFINYTISEDRTGNQEGITRKRLAALGAHCVLRMSRPQAEELLITPKPKDPVDVEKQCGVTLPNGQQCARSLTCKSHSMGAKRAVPGRSLPYNILLQAYQKKNQAPLPSGTELLVSPDPPTPSKASAKANRPSQQGEVLQL